MNRALTLGDLPTTALADVTLFTRLCEILRGERLRREEYHRQYDHASLTAVPLHWPFRAMSVADVVKQARDDVARQTLFAQSAPGRYIGAVQEAQAAGAAAEHNIRAMHQTVDAALAARSRGLSANISSAKQALDELVEHARSLNAAARLIREAVDAARQAADDLERSLTVVA